MAPFQGRQNPTPRAPLRVESRRADNVEIQPGALPLAALKTSLLQLAFTGARWNKNPHDVADVGMVWISSVDG